MKIFVTGAAGFIGFHVARRLLADGAVVVGYDNLNPYYDPALKLARLDRLKVQPKFQFIHGDLENQTLLNEALTDGPFTAVIHLAAQAGVRHSLDHPETYIQSNIVGFSHVLELCHQHSIPHLIYASSSSVYGSNSHIPFSPTDNVDHPISLYAATKKANELMAHAYSHLYRLPTTGLRFFTVYGPWGRPDMAYFKFTEAILANRPIDVFNHGELWRDFTYVDDIVEAVAQLVNRIPTGFACAHGNKPNPAYSTAPYKIYNIGNNQPIRLLDFIALLESAIGKKAILQMKPMQPGDVLTTCADIEELRRDIGFSPRTPIADGLNRFVEWHRDYRSIST